jgi:hypothetical protein
MAIVELPRVRSRQVLDSTGPLVQLDARPPPTGAQDLGAALGGTAQVAAGVLAQQQARDQRAELAGLEAQLVDQETRMLLSARERKGRDAFGAAEQTSADFDKVSEELAKTITSPKVREAYDELRTMRRASLFRGIAGHEAEQKSVYQTAQAKAQMESMVNLVAANPEALEYAMARSLQTVDAESARLGLPKEVAAQDSTSPWWVQC